MDMGGLGNGGIRVHDVKFPKSNRTFFLSIVILSTNVSLR